MYLFYEQVAIDTVVKDVAAFNVPAKATHVELQADTGNIRYTMDNTTAPTTSSGMILYDGKQPKTFLVEDLLRMKFIRDGAAAAALNIHYFAGRDI